MGSTAGCFPYLLSNKGKNLEWPQNTHTPRGWKAPLWTWENSQLGGKTRDDEKGPVSMLTPDCLEGGHGRPSRSRFQALMIRNHVLASVEEKINLLLRHSVKREVRRIKQEKTVGLTSPGRWLLWQVLLRSHPGGPGNEINLLYLPSFLPISYESSASILNV